MVPWSLVHANALKGNAIRAVASWTWEEATGPNATRRVASLSHWAGRTVQLRVAMVDAKLFSLRMVCAAAAARDRL